MCVCKFLFFFLIKGDILEEMFSSCLELRLLSVSTGEHLSTDRGSEPVCMMLMSHLINQLWAVLPLSSVSLERMHFILLLYK